MKSTQSQIVTFCSALSSICDGRIKVVCDGRACTDGNVIHLPWPHQILAPDGHLVIQGIACHEAAHIYFDTPPRYQEFVARYSGPSQSLAADCYNAVADIADESRFEKCFKLARQYFQASTNHAAISCLEFEDGNFTQPFLCLENTKDILIAAMLEARRSRIQDVSAKFALRRATFANMAVRESVKVLKRALSRIRNPKQKRKNPEWNRYSAMAEQLLVILTNSGLPQPDSPNQGPGESSDSVGKDASGSTDEPSVESQKCKGKKPENQCEENHNGSTCENVTTSLEMNENGGGGAMAEVFQELVGDATEGKVGTQGLTGYKNALTDILLEANPALKATFRRYARLLLQAPKPIVSLPSYSGPKLGDVSRLRIDGKVLLRRVRQPDVGTAVAIALDCSVSMQEELAQVGTTASHLAHALSDAGGNIACWYFGDAVSSVSLRRLHRVRLMGGTRTDLAVAAGRDWLEQQTEEKKVLCVFTDGRPNRGYLCAEEVKKCRRVGVKVLVGAVHCSASQLYVSMPGAELFEVGDNLAVGFHQAVRRIAR